MTAIMSAAYRTCTPPQAFIPACPVAPPTTSPSVRAMNQGRAGHRSRRRHSLIVFHGDQDRVVVPSTRTAWPTTPSGRSRRPTAPCPCDTRRQTTSGRVPTATPTPRPSTGRHRPHHCRALDDPPGRHSLVRRQSSGSYTTLGDRMHPPSSCVFFGHIASALTQPAVPACRCRGSARPAYPPAPRRPWHRRCTLLPDVVPMRPTMHSVTFRRLGAGIVSIRWDLRLC